MSAVIIVAGMFVMMVRMLIGIVGMFINPHLPCKHSDAAGLVINEVDMSINPLIRPIIMMTLISINTVIIIPAVYTIIIWVTMYRIMVTVIITLLCMLVPVMGVLVFTDGILMHRLGMCLLLVIRHYYGDCYYDRRHSHHRDKWRACYTYGLRDHN